MNKSIEIYNYLIDNCIGYDNRIKANLLMEKFFINDHKTLRSYIKSARLNPNCEYLIGSEAGKKGGYWIATNSSEKEVTFNNFVLRANEMKKNAKFIKRKKLYEYS